MIRMDKKDIVKAGIWGVVVGDVLGVPVEFMSRAELKADPVVGMREYGTHDQPRGTWSDDSSMMFAAMDSFIENGLFRCEDIMEKFRNWRLNGKYTPHGKVFDIGITCARAIDRYRPGMDSLSCGESDEYSNGNGSLMRIMPVSLNNCTETEFWCDSYIEDAALDAHNISKLTHAHPRSQMACLLHAAICHELIYRNGRTLPDSVQCAVGKTFEFYRSADEKMPWFDKSFSQEIRSEAYGRLNDIQAFKNLPEDEIKSSGYVVHTLEAAIWCLLNTESFSECVLRAVNLGDDTDTVGAVTGGFAALVYGYESIPKEWLDVIASKEWISKLCDDFAYIVDYD